MNSAQDGLSSVGELLEHTADGEGGLTVQTRGRLVEEEEHGRLGSKFDTDSNTLSVSHSQTKGRVANDGIGELVKLEELDDVFDVLVLLLNGCLIRLSEISTESQSLSNTAHGLVDVLLLCVTTLSLEGNVDRLALDETVTFDDTNGLAVGENVE